jgi:hypothetical protein
MKREKNGLYSISDAELHHLKLWLKEEVDIAGDELDEALETNNVQWLKWHIQCLRILLDITIYDRILSD